LAKLRFVQCPVCGTENPRSVRTNGLLEIFLTLFGLYAFRCENCARKFLARPIGVRGVAYAKCPKCYRMDLTVWDPKYYRCGWWMNLKISFGANRWRCEPCRTNFVSWRPRKARYVRPVNDAGEANEG